MAIQWREIGILSSVLFACSLYCYWSLDRMSQDFGIAKSTPSSTATTVKAKVNGASESGESRAKLSIAKVYVGMSKNEVLEIFGQKQDSVKKEGWALLGGYHDRKNDEVAVFFENEACAIAVGTSLSFDGKRVVTKKSNLIREFGEPSRRIMGPVNEVWVYDDLLMLIEVGVDANSQARVMLGTTDTEMLKHTFGGLP